MMATAFPIDDIPAQGSAKRRQLFGLHSLEAIHALLRRERARADRTGAEFSLVLFRVGESRRATHRLARTLAERARNIDEVGWFDERFLCAVLPTTSATGAVLFAEDVCRLVTEKITRPLYDVYSYPAPGAATGAAVAAPATTAGSANPNVGAAASGADSAAAPPDPVAAFRSGLDAVLREHEKSTEASEGSPAPRASVFRRVIGKVGSTLGLL